MQSIIPGFGMHSKFYNEVLGKKVTYSIEKGTHLDSKYFEER
jgi:pseudaminic acid synthase